MKHTHRFTLLLLIVLATLAAFSQAEALQSTKTFKVVQLQFLVTPSPAPSVGFLPHHGSEATTVAIAHAPVVAQPMPATVFDNPFPGPFQVASAGATWDVAPGIMIAQVQAQPTPVPVQFKALADPNGAYLKVTYESSQPLAAAYGPNAYSCVFEVFTYYTTAYTLNDFGYGTSTSGGTATFPIENYPTTDYLSWAIYPAVTGYTAFYNEGTPGQTVWSKAAGVSYTGCFDLSLTVPTTLAPGTYTASIQFNLNVNL